MDRCLRAKLTDHPSLQHLSAIRLTKLLKNIDGLERLTPVLRTATVGNSIAKIWNCASRIEVIEAAAPKRVWIMENHDRARHRYSTEEDLGSQTVMQRRKTGQPDSQCPPLESP
jgi:hypothetical protein